MTIERLNRHVQPRARFCLFFVIWALSFSIVFEHWQFLFVDAYLYPVSAVAARLLNAIGVETQIDISSLSHSFCLLRMENLTFRVIFECMGIFPLFIFAAATLAYEKAKALGLGLEMEW